MGFKLFLTVDTVKYTFSNASININHDPNKKIKVETMSIMSEIAKKEKNKFQKKKIVEVISKKKKNVALCIEYM